MNQTGPSDWNMCSGIFGPGGRDTGHNDIVFKTVAIEVLAEMALTVTHDVLVNRR